MLLDSKTYFDRLLYLGITLEVLIFFPLAVDARQNQASIVGKISHEAGFWNNVSVEVHTENSIIKTTTEKKGDFSIYNLVQGKTKIIASNLGQVIKDTSFYYAKGTTVNINWNLKNETRQLSEVLITAGGIQQQIRGMEATVQVLERKELDNAGIQSLDQAMTRIAGAVSQDEDGRGLKPNYSLRGLDPERSSSVLTLVDGKIPSGTMYYGDPGGYYMLPLEQVEKVEVIKGGATAVLFGGYTIGGVVNLVTKQAPMKRTTRVELGYGSWNQFTAQINTGAKKGNFEYLINAYRRQGDGPRTDRSDFDLNDINARLGIDIDSTTKLSLYLDAYSENSETPGGLTQAQFYQDPKQVQNPYDQFIAKRFSTHISLDKKFGQYQQLTLATYGNYFSRDWYLSRKDTQSTYSDVIGYVRDLPAGGFLTDYKLSKDINGHKNLFITGGRLHADRYNNKTIKGFYPGAHIGETTADLITNTTVSELYAYDKYHIASTLSASLGVRWSNIHYTQNNYTSKNENNTIGRKDKTSINAVVYSAGINYEINDQYELFASASRGFQPPLIYDVLDASTIDNGVKLKPQYSGNYEIGTRMQPASWFTTQLSVYYINFKNKIIYDANEGISRNIAVSTHKGIELNLNTLAWNGFSTYITATYQEAKVSDGENEGNFLRYAPKILLAAGVQHHLQLFAGNLNTALSFNYVGKQFSDELNTTLASDDGFTGSIPAYKYYNVNVNYEKRAWGIRLGINNLFNEKYFNRRWDFWGGIMPAPGRNFQSSIFYKF